ncbi:MAG TPA: sugar phosphate isomerase/epimerase family protein [Candidatus Hydrogenedentes bacterium]|nr:sugar phosphate isomerase/epimerase family protein [Candidatus Hydrogenedentota bacterium]HPG68526.1 sugar phosphate isomerase/epimerase family protein [Candidatus Hydrogenedentota bacterium]
MNRRSFMKAAGTVAAATVAVSAASPATSGEFTGQIKKAVKYDMIQGDFSVVEKFQLLKDIGFDGVEPSVREKVDPEEMLAASKATGLPIHGVVNGSTADLRAAVDRAKCYGASSVLVVAGRVNEEMSYADNYTATQATIREAIPYAEANQIMLLVENVWNNFLLSPLEMARYIDELESEWVGVYFDVGNVVRFAWPEHWIPVLGKRIRKLDIKEYSRQKQNDEGLWKGFNVEIGEGSIDWTAVRRELKKIGYSSWATAEVGGGGRERLEDIARRMNQVLDL